MIYEELEKEGKLTARIYEWLPFDATVEQLDTWRKAHPTDDNMLRVGMLKGFMDGSLGSPAALLEPYADDDKNSGIPQYEVTKLDAMTKARVLDGFQIGFHAIGDRVCRWHSTPSQVRRKTRVRKGSGEWRDDYRLRIEHAQVTTPADLEVQELKVVA